MVSNENSLYFTNLMRPVSCPPTLNQYDLVVFGGSVIGLAAAYFAVSGKLVQNNKICIVSNKKLEDYESDMTYQAVSNPIQNNGLAHTRYALESNKVWKQLENQLECQGQFLITEGAVNFGEKDSKMKFGNIVLSNYVMEQINQDSQVKIKKTFLDSITKTSPQYFQNFKMEESEELSWSALYQPEGSVIRQFQVHKKLTSFLQKNGVEIKYSSFLKDCKKTQDGYKFEIKNYEKGIEENISTSKVFMAEDDLWTGYYLKYLVEKKENSSKQLFDELILENHTVSYCELSSQDKYSENLPVFSNYLKILLGAKTQGFFGMRPHDWDNPKELKKSIKIRSTIKKEIDKNQFLEMAKNDKLYQPNIFQQGVSANVNYAQSHLYVSGKYEHYPYLRVKCEGGRQTILGYLHRNIKNFVVQTSGFFEKFSAMLGKNAIQMLYEPEKDIAKLCAKQSYNYLSLIRYPIRNYVKQLLQENGAKIDDYYKNNKQQPLSFDTVVVGAGCGGLYSAYRLFKDGKEDDKKLAIFEMTDRISGRLMSFRFKGGMTAVQLGGMRYIPESHPLLVKIIDDLQIPVIDFPMKGDPLQTYHRRAFLRNTPYSQEQWALRQEAKQRLTTSYNIAENFMTEQGFGNKIIGMAADQMLTYSFWKVVNEIERNRNSVTALLGSEKEFEKCFKKQSPISYKVELNLYQWNKIKQILVFQMPFKDKNDADIYVPLYKMGCQNVLQMQFGHEAYLFMTDQSGYNSNTMNCSYNQLICTYLIDFFEVEYKTLQGGYDMMNYNIANYLLDPNVGLSTYDQNCGIYLNHELIDIEEQKEGGYKLIFQTKSNNPQQRVVKAKNIILAMPKRSVELVANKTKLFTQSLLNYNPETYTSKQRNYYQNDSIMKKSTPIIPKNIYDLLGTAYAIPAIRIMMNFTENWWDPIPTFNREGAVVKSAKQMRGVSVTDLPIRQTLYFSTPTQNMILGSYNDLIPSQYWTPLQLNFVNDEQPDQVKSREFIVEISKNSSVNYEHRASHVLEKQLCRQLSLIHGKDLNVILKSLKECCYQNWEIDPYGGGYHNFRSGYDIESCMVAIRRPLKRVNNQVHDIFVVGQAFSNLPGWVEGAYQTCQKVLIQHYRLPPATNHYNGY